MEKYKQIVFWAARIILAGVFVNASVSKIARPDEFYTAIMNYQILPQYLAYVLSYFLPVLELVCSIALLWNVFCKAAISLIYAMLIVFIIGIISAWLRGLNISCGCFGSENAVGEYLKVMLRDVFLIGLCSIIFLLSEKKDVKRNVNL